jgi:hypothetical protein
MNILQKIMVVNEMQTQVRNSFKDNHFMVLGFSAANGHPIVCVIIVAASKLKVIDVTGFNPLSDDGQDVCGEEMKALQEEIDAMKDEHSNSSDRMFPFRITCTFNVVEVPMFVTSRKKAATPVNYLPIGCPRWTIIASLTAATGSIPFCYVMVMAAGLRNHFLNTPWIPIGIGLVASVCPMGRLRVSSETVQSRMGCSILRVKRQRQIQ